MTLRIVVLVTHLLGAGHLMRAAAIGRALARRGHVVTLVSGGMPTPLADVTGLALVQLPAVRAEPGDFSTLRDSSGRPASTGLMDERVRLLLQATEAARPDVLVTELFPLGRRGLAAEHDSVLAAVEGGRKRPLVVASVRDILVAPDRPTKVAEAHRRVEAHYDAVLVHGDEAFVPLEASWPVDDGLRARVRYTGYVGPEAAASSRAGDDGTVLVSGGSSEAALPLYRAALEAARADPRPWRVLVGHGVTETAFARLSHDRPANLVVERARADFRDLLAQAAIFVGQAGYNTVMDIVATQARSVLVPFEAGRETEQRLRADALARRGLARTIPETELTPAALLAAVAETGLRERPDLSFIRLDGAERTARLLESMVAARAGAGPVLPS